MNFSRQLTRGLFWPWFFVFFFLLSSLPFSLLIFLFTNFPLSHVLFYFIYFFLLLLLPCFHYRYIFHLLLFLSFFASFIVLSFFEHPSCIHITSPTFVCGLCFQCYKSYSNGTQICWLALLEHQSVMLVKVICHCLCFTKLSGFCMNFSYFHAVHCLDCVLKFVNSTIYNRRQNQLN